MFSTLRISVSRGLLHLCGLLLALFAATPMQAQPQSKTEEHALFRLENEWAQAVISRDAATLRRMTAPRWVYSDESGVMERDAGIKAFTSGTDTVRIASNEKMRALIYDNTAAVIGMLVMKGTGPRGAFARRYRYTDTWVKLDGRWQCIASQDYLVPAKKH